MGDSITDFWGAATRGGPFFPGKPYINRGISGQTTAQMLLRFHQDVVMLKPKLVVFLAGTNDIGGQSGSGDDRGDRGQPDGDDRNGEAGTGSRVVLADADAGVRLSSSADADASAGADRRAECVDAGVCREERDHAVLDYYPAMMDDKRMLRKELTGDGLHPERGRL